ncbi:unnamed protein product [Owenia fusiformis]|uniref:Uncharacterized protein n=1 Tax=Owenia fusiformis TaxID=6347 RepID=A0A8J1TRD7_OWEFU|nr:unnamed protein product [Owenia fusiformis]
MVHFDGNSRGIVATDGEDGMEKINLKVISVKNTGSGDVTSDAQRESLVLRVENKVAEFKQTHDIRTIRLVIALFLVFLVLMTLVAIVVALKVTATHKFDIHCQFNSTTNLTSCVSSPSKLQ